MSTMIIRKKYVIVGNNHRSSCSKQSNWYSYEKQFMQNSTWAPRERCIFENISMQLLFLKHYIIQDVNIILKLPALRVWVNYIQFPKESCPWNTFKRMKTVTDRPFFHLFFTTYGRTKKMKRDIPWDLLAHGILLWWAGVTSKYQILHLESQTQTFNIYMLWNIFFK